MRPFLAMTATESGCFRGLGNGGNPNWSLIRGRHNSLILMRLYLHAVGFLYNISVGFLQTEDGMRQQKTLRDRIEGRIARRQREDVFLPREFADLGGEDQVLRALRQLVREKRLVRLGYGVYGRAVVSRLSGEAILYSPNGFLGAARQALNKVGGGWGAT